jgi:outer membrane protein insertion porin family
VRRDVDDTAASRDLGAAVAKDLARNDLKAVLLFADAGNVFGEGQNFSFSNLRKTAGVELRITLPVFGAPLRFIYAKNLDPLPQDSFEDFQFSIGTSF